MGKIKIHEIAKELNLASKDVIAKANELNIQVKSHLSGVTEEEASKIKGALTGKKAASKKEETKKKENKKEKNNSSPVIIRREVIINDEDNKKEKQVKKQEENKAKIGFVERDRKKDFNIVYRNKPNKPMTVDELFGLNKKKKEEPKKEEVKQSKVEEKMQEVKENKTVDKTEKVEKNENVKKQENFKQNKTQYQPRNNYNNNRNNNYNRNNDRNNNNNNRNNNYNRNNNGNNNGYRNNRPGNNFGRGNRPLDEKGIEKNIKNIMSSDVVEKESVREYNRNADKQKNANKYDDKKSKKNKNKRGNNDLGFNEGKLKSLKQESSLSNMFTDQEGGMLDYYDLTTVRGKRNKKKNSKAAKGESKQKIFKLTEITIPETISVKDLAAELKKTSAEVIKKLFSLGVMATINNDVDFDTAYLIAQEFGVTAKLKEEIKEEDVLFDESEDLENELMPRPPVIVVMGHVDHGKTSLLDAIRKTNVIEGEAGGITQAIGAYQVKLNGRDITFLDTPGHEAFTAMRARGAQITDIAILVVAANDGVMPQTVEAVNHAKSAGIPIIVAVNKMDLPGANVERIKEELMKYDLVPEEWGGDTIYVPISAKNGTNIDQLLEMVLLVADMKDLKANPTKQAKGAVIEARLDKTKGPIATMLVQRGKLDVGDTIVVGSSIGRIRAMKNDKGQRVKFATPSMPVEIMGLTEVPTAGDTFYEVKDEKMAKHLIERRKRQAREKSINQVSKVTLDDLFSQIEKGDLKQLNLIVKADVQGSVEAVKQSLEKLSDEKVQVKVIHAAAGAVTESDVTLAKVSNAIIIAFNVRPVASAKEMADREEVEIKQYSVIYQAIEDVEAAMKGMWDPEFEEKVIGTVEVRQTFKVSGVGTIAGGYVLTGKVERNAGVRVIREDVVIHQGELASLKRFKDDVKEVAKGYECGLQIANYNDIKEGDIIEVYVMEEIKR